MKPLLLIVALLLLSGCGADPIPRFQTNDFVTITLDGRKAQVVSGEYNAFEGITYYVRYATDGGYRVIELKESELKPYHP